MLLDLPPELLVEVASQLNTVELGRFRLSCKAVERCLFDSFAAEFFTKRQFALEEVSLQALVDISSHPELSPRLTEVILSLEQFEHRGPQTTWAADSQHAIRAAYNQAFVDVGLAREMLEKAFRALPNLRVIGVRDYNARGRTREGPTALWRSYGWTSTYPELASRQDSSVPPQKYCLENGLDAGIRYTRQNTLATVLPIVLFAAGRSQAGLRLDSIEVFLRRHYVTPELLQVLQTGAMSQKIVPVISGLKRLMLTLGLDAMTGHGAPHLPSSDTDPIDVPLKRFLHHTPRLNTLRLNFLQGQHYCNPLLRFLGRNTPTTKFDPLVHPPAFANLSTLELGMANVALPILLSVITKFGPKLKSLSLWKVSLLHEQQTLQARSKQDLWSTFLSAFAACLPDLDPSLQSIMLGYVSEQSVKRPLLEHRVAFRPEGSTGDDEEKDLLKTLNFKASSVHIAAKKWLQDLAGRVIMPQCEEDEALDAGASDSNGPDSEFDGMDSDEVAELLGGTDSDLDEDSDEDDED